MGEHSKITFYGGAGSVTGANFLLDTGDKKILIDCGALEREAAHGCDVENGKPFAYDPASIDVLIVTHAHQDHIGRVPKLVRDGFKGMIYSTPATKDLSALMFEDSVNVMHTDAQMRGCAVMYEREDYERALSLWRTREYHESFKVGDVHVEFLDAGHILGSAMIRVSRNERSIIFTGDLGNSPEPLLQDAESPEGANYLLMESVYGDRLHEDRADRTEIVKAAIEATRSKGGTLLVPSFSIERTQILLFEIDKMIEKGEMQPIPVYLDAPLAIKVTEVYRKYRHLLNADAQSYFKDGADPFSFKNLHVVKDVAESRKIHEAPNPKVIIAGAGMSVGGRIRSHEAVYLPDPKATVLFVGYQAPGSLGRRIEDGNKEVVIDGRRVPVRAEIMSVSGYSGHADRDALLSFVEKAAASLEKVFVVMGEPKSEIFLAQRIQDYLGIEAHVPETAEQAEIDL